MSIFTAKIGGENQFSIAKEFTPERDIGARPEHGAADRIDAFQLVVVLKNDAAGRDWTERAESDAGGAAHSFATIRMIEWPAIGSRLGIGRAATRSGDIGGGPFLGLVRPERLGLLVRMLLPRIDGNDLAADGDEQQMTQASAAYESAVT